MAIINENDPLLNGIRGRIGDFVVKRSYGRSILCKRPAKRAVNSEAQIGFMNRFKLAAMYGRATVKNAELKKLYETGITDKKRSAYQVAFTDFLTAPIIHEIDVSEYRGSIDDYIIVEATDDFKVVSVEVHIATADGVEVESGDANKIKASKKYWSYLCTKHNAAVSGTKVTVSVTDFAGNVTTKHHVIA